MDPEAVVYRLLERETLRRRDSIRAEHRLVADLKMDGDDFAMSFVRELQKELGFRARREEWEQVVTVADVLELVRQYVR